jgi:hypothetical protein
MNDKMSTLIDWLHSLGMFLFAHPKKKIHFFY